MQISLEEYRKLSDRIAELERENEELREAVACPPHWMHWVSVKDRLPNFEQPVLAYSGEELGIGFAYLDGDGKWYGDCGDVTHWMPLPAPPEVEDVQG